MTEEQVPPQYDNPDAEGYEDFQDAVYEEEEGRPPRVYVASPYLSAHFPTVSTSAAPITFNYTSQPLDEVEGDEEFTLYSEDQQRRMGALGMAQHLSENASPADLIHLAEYILDGTT
jgi:hypothetical protein